MKNKAPRLLLRGLHRQVRGARLALCVVWAGLGLVPLPVLADTITSARFTEPTARYAHGVLGDAIEWGALEIDVANGRAVGLRANAVVRNTTYVVKLPLDHVFEDVAPRLVDVDNDGDMEVMVVESDVHNGAALALYGTGGKITETPHIGMRNRWLAPIGAADLDGDGAVEIAYIDRPHLAKTLRIWRYENGTLTEVAALERLTNHRIGETDIAGGMRDCGTGQEMVLATANWAELVAVRWDGAQFTQRVLGRDTSRPAFARALACKG